MSPKKACRHGDHGVSNLNLPIARTTVFAVEEEMALHLQHSA